MIRGKHVLPVAVTIFIFSLIFFSPFLTTPSMAAEASGPIKIGALLPLTGALLHQGPKARDGIQWALDDAKWQVAGRKIELILEDSATDPTTAPASGSRDLMTK